MAFRIISECHVDTTLAVFFVGNKQAVSHESGIGRVANAMKNAPKNADTILIGWIDDDKRKPTYFSDFVEIEVENNVSLKQKINTKEYLIVINPAAEKMLLSAAESVKLDFEKYQLNPEFKAFCNQLKSPTIEQNADFQSFIKDLLANNAAVFLTLKSFFERITV